MKKTIVVIVAVIVIIIAGLGFIVYSTWSKIADASNPTDTIATFVIEKTTPIETKWSVQYFKSVASEQNPITKSINSQIAKTICGKDINVEHSFEALIEECFLINYMNNIPIIQSEHEATEEYYELCGGILNTGNMGNSDAISIYVTGEFIPSGNENKIVCYKFIFDNAYGSRIYPSYSAYNMETGNAISLSDVIGCPIYDSTKQSLDASTDKKTYTAPALKLKLLIVESLIEQFDLTDYEDHIYEIELIGSFYLTPDGIVFGYDGVMIPNSPTAMWGSPYNVLIPYEKLKELNILGDVILDFYNSLRSINI